MYRKPVLFIILAPVAISIIWLFISINQQTLSEKEAKYQNGIELIKQEKWDEAGITLFFLAEDDNYKNSRTLRNYANAKEYYNKKQYDMVEYALSFIPDNYSGDYSEKILADKKTILTETTKISEVEKSKVTDAEIRAKIEANLKTSANLHLLSWRWNQSAGGMFVEAVGQVKNISGSKLDNVMAVVSFYDKNGDFITSADALIDYNPIMPGQTSPFKVIETYNPAMQKASVEFKYLMGGTIPTYKDQ
ncbi:MAG: hypothetical protein C4589_09855 [Peptococcaceae bacterium]|nr:MAG: hypothetical protein C4589_09855 [Peptococcaceae bacterium]